MSVPGVFQMKPLAETVFPLKGIPVVTSKNCSAKNAVVVAFSQTDDNVESGHIITLPLVVKHHISSFCLCKILATLTSVNVIVVMYICMCERHVT